MAQERNASKRNNETTPNVKKDHAHRRKLKDTHAYGTYRGKNRNVNKNPTDNNRVGKKKKETTHEMY